MKDTKAFYKSAKSLLLCLLSLTIATGCLPLGMDGPYDEEDHPTLKPESHYFDFGTTRQVTLNIDYGKMGSRALLELYIENPTVTAEDGSVSYKDGALFKTFCNKQGRYSGKVTLPAYADSVYVYTMRAGVPTLMKAKIEKNKAEIKLDYGKPLSRVWVNTDYGGREPGDEFEVIGESNGYKIWKAPTLNPAENIYTIVNWVGSRFGQVINFDDIDPFYYWGNSFEGGDNQGLIDDGDYTDPYEIDEIQYFLWNKRTKKPQGGLGNDKYVPEHTEVVNTIIPEDATDDNGNKIDGVEVWLTFISEAAQYQNAIGYYYYKNSDTPKSAADIDAIYIAIPNASIGEEKPFVTTTNADYKMYEAMFAPMAPNKRVQLLYYDKSTRKVSKKFPLGYTIGYFVASAETKPKMGTNPMTNKTMKVYNKPGLMFYSNKEYNDRARFIALNDKDKIIYGLEDGENGGDSSFEDILFTIETSPKGIAINGDRPSVDMEKFIIDETTHRTYAYEDIWPHGGDYDMNDVVIDHEQTISFIEDEEQDNDNCIVTRITDRFTVLQPGNAATYVDAFAIQLPDDPAYKYSRIILPPGAIHEKDTRSVILFTHAMQELGKTFSITRYFDDEDVTKGSVRLETPGADGVIRNSLNPYIISKYDEASEEERTEIHLPKHSATSRAHTGKIGSGDDAYYINKDNKHPFAISLPLSVTEDWGRHFTHPSGEGVEIGTSHPHFDRWVDSKGEEHPDWYLHPAE